VVYPFALKSLGVGWYPIRFGSQDANLSHLEEERNMGSPKIPTTYEEMFHTYQPLVSGYVRRVNRLPEFERDIVQHLWGKVLEVDLLAKFKAHTNNQTEQRYTALQACDILGVTWEDWLLAAREYHENASPLWMPTPANIGDYRGSEWLSDQNAEYSTDDILMLSVGDSDGQTALRVGARKVVGGVDQGPSPHGEGYVEIPEYQPSEALFRNYLNRAISNHYANYCRTVSRRHQERCVKVSPHSPSKESWEETLLDTAKSSEVFEKLQTVKAHIRAVLELDYGLPGITEVVFSKMENTGETLAQAMKGVVPLPARKAILNLLQGTK